MNKANRSNKRYVYVGNSVELLLTKRTILEQILISRVRVQRQALVARIGNPLVQLLGDKLGYRKHPTQGVTMKSDKSVLYYSSVVGSTLYYLIRHDGVYHVYKECK